MKNYQGYLIDLDGTVYEGERKIKYASSFIEEVKKHNIPHLYLTNNSSKTSEGVAEKLTKLGILTKKEEVLTSGEATAQYIEKYYSNAKILPIGEQGLLQPLKEKGFSFTAEHPDIVVMGIDREITYSKFAKACEAIYSGAKFIATNSDMIVPTNKGMLPGNGSLISVVTNSTGVTPTFVGKPEPVIIEQALDILKTNKKETLIIGDNYQTDILSGKRYGIDQLLVHTGVTTKDLLKNCKSLPTYSIDSLKDWKVFPVKQINF